MSDATFSLLTDRISHDFFSSNDLGSRVTVYLRDEALLIFAPKKNLKSLRFRKLFFYEL